MNVSVLIVSCSSQSTRNVFAYVKCDAAWLSGCIGIAAVYGCEHADKLALVDQPWQEVCMKTEEKRQ